ncbi:MAG: hydantoinase/oxoprolinase family protein, partial [Chloroflexi bacterium]|nr:hydantoinase/oxoprolinase family protein [Chloroflexota bacterium]
MAIVLGIYTGGTYTDAVLVDHESGAILAGAKALTTHNHLQAGIAGAIERVLAAPAARHVRVEDVRLVSVSTTLATNAIAEGRGAPICALLIGYQDALPDEESMQRPEFDLPQARYAFVRGGHDPEGVEREPLDLYGLRAAILQHAPHVAAFAISGYFGTRNPEHELEAKRMVAEMTGLPVTCGHELTHQLDAIRRAMTVNLNATLIPLLTDLIAAVEQTMAQHGICAPLMVVKGDGSLMESSLAKERPIETILSGPAASVVGAQHLAGGLQDMVVVDMGGTTTDIAVIQAGHPRLSPRGARVGRWHTMIEAIEAHTAGLGGDSRVWLDAEHSLQVGPTRVVPLSLLASERPETLDALRRQAERTKPAGSDGEFLLLRSDESESRWSETERPPFHAELMAALHRGPLAVDEVLRMMEHPFLYMRYLERLERLGVVMRAGFTPTDAAHVANQYREWSLEAAELGARLLGRRVGLQPEAFSTHVLELTSLRIAEEVVHKLWNDDRHNGNHGMDRDVLAVALHPAPENTLECAFVVKPELVA